MRSTIFAAMAIAISAVSITSRPETSAERAAREKKEGELARTGCKGTYEEDFATHRGSDAAWKASEGYRNYFNCSDYGVCFNYTRDECLKRAADDKGCTWKTEDPTGKALKV
jgi:hypothetical protein